MVSQRRDGASDDAIGVECSTANRTQAVRYLLAKFGRGVCAIGLRGVETSFTRFHLGIGLSQICNAIFDFLGVLDHWGRCCIVKQRKHILGTDQFGSCLDEGRESPAQRCFERQFRWRRDAPSRGVTAAGDDQLTLGGC